MAPASTDLGETAVIEISSDMPISSFYHITNRQQSHGLFPHDVTSLQEIAALRYKRETEAITRQAEQTRIKFENDERIADKQQIAQLTEDLSRERKARQDDKQQIAQLTDDLSRERKARQDDKIAYDKLAKQAADDAKGAILSVYQLHAVDAKNLRALPKGLPTNNLDLKWNGRKAKLVNPLMRIDGQPLRVGLTTTVDGGTTKHYLSPTTSSGEEVTFRVNSEGLWHLVIPYEPPEDIYVGENGSVWTGSLFDWKVTKIDRGYIFTPAFIDRPIVLAINPEGSKILMVNIQDAPSIHWVWDIVEC